MKFVNGLVYIVLAAIISIGLVALPIKTAVANAQSANIVSSVYNKSVLHLKFSEGTNISLSGNIFVSDKNIDNNELNQILSDKNVHKKQRLLRENKSILDAKHKKAEAETGEYITNLNTYFRINLKPGQDSQKIALKLKKLPYVLDAYPEPLPARTPASPLFVSQQKYLKASPSGMGVEASSAQPGIKGQNVTIADLEYSWNINHEDISDARVQGAIVANGTAIDPWGDKNHGTAVAGVLNGDHNGFGINGIVPDAKLKLINTNNSESGWDVANAINVAMNNLKKGDVILIEQQVWGPNGELLPVEWVPAAYDAIKLATASGINVVEAAGNSGVNLSDPIYGTKFPMGKPDSGAIIVGAGATCGYQPDRSRLYFSNYGTRVNLQGFGECVVTTGYGWLHWGGENALYTGSFDGTSSASATIAGIVAAFASAYESANAGTPIKPAKLRSALVASGASSKQNNKVNKGKIGPLPNLLLAIQNIDGTKPTKPTNFSVVLNSNKKPLLSWNASTDNKAVAYYRILRDNKQISTTQNLSYIDNTAVSGATYKYKVQAVDTSGNKSKASTAISVAIP